MIQLQHTNGPAPSYVIKSDSEDDNWVDDLNNSLRNQHQDDLSKRSLSWEPRITSPKRLGRASDLTVLVGNAGSLVANGFEDQDIFRNGSLLRLEKRITLSESGRVVLSARRIPLLLQTVLAPRLLSDLTPAPNYVPSSENQLLRYVSYSPNCSLSHWSKGLQIESLQVPNLIRGFEAALITTASILKIPTNLILIPLISTNGPNSSIPSGTYSYSTLNSCLVDNFLSSFTELLVDDLRGPIQSVLNWTIRHHAWKFPNKISKNQEKIFKGLNQASPILDSAKISTVSPSDDQHEAQKILNSDGEGPDSYQAVSKATNQSLLWGTYRPNLYFGLKPCQPNSLITGMIWFAKDDYSSFDCSRHTCEQGDKLGGYGYDKHDGQNFASHFLRDELNNLDARIQFLKTPGGDHEVCGK
ncbi:mannosyl oligosaccharide glucosidase-domain-containing protein [Phakopsora pachyrhizi]|nr:mannosyl oligosaccharide glucosidase-domain-containing protein [Phakopsora pachyrhizi]